MAVLAFVLTGIAAFALAATDMPATQARIAAAAVLALGTVSAYLALRSTMDAHFFGAFLETESLPATFAAFDSALQSLGWIPDAKAGRALTDRVRGAQRLVHVQAVVLLAQVLLVAAIPWLR